MIKIAKLDANKVNYSDFDKLQVNLSKISM